MHEGGEQRQKRRVRPWHRFGNVFTVPVTQEESRLDRGPEGSSLAKGISKKCLGAENFNGWLSYASTVTFPLSEKGQRP